MRTAVLPMRRSTHENAMHDQPDDSTAPGDSAPALPSASEGLDAESLDRLRELDPGGKSHLLERVFQAFETSLSRLMPQLLEARAAGDLAGIRHVTHTLKSSSASIGALRMAQLCAEIEHMIRQEAAAIDILWPLIDQVHAESTVVSRALVEALDDPA